MNAFLKDDGTPDVAKLVSTFNRCAPTVAGGIQWLDNIRFCRWPNQFTDGRKHDLPNNPNGAAKPWDGASDCRPFVVDGIINESKDTLTEAFWRALMRPGSAGDDAGSYAVALADHLIWTVLLESLTKEVELSAQYIKHYGWCMLAPRWCREISLKRKTIKLADIQAGAQQATAALTQSQNAQPLPPDQQARLQMLADLPGMIGDPTREAEAVQSLQSWYDDYVKQSLPEEIRDTAPSTTAKQVRKVVAELRQYGTSSAPIPYLCKDQPEVSTLKPWDEVFLPPEMTTVEEIIFQREMVSASELDNRVLSEGYDKGWVEAAKKFRGQLAPSQMPVGQGGNAVAQLAGAATAAPIPQVIATGNSDTGLVEIIHAIYRDTDEDGVPGVYITTVHRSIQADKTGKVMFAKHGIADGAGHDLGYVAGVNEWWCRSITASRSVPEIAHTDQNLIKGTFDAIVDRTSITLCPPVNVYESPLQTEYHFGPATKNFVRQGREPAFMQMPSGQGLADGVETHALVSKRLDNYHGLMSNDVPPSRVQTSQATQVRRFLLMWSAALKQVLALCQRHMKDVDFAEITGAPAGWLDGHREETNLLQAGLHFDVRELDAEITLKQIEAVNKTVLPGDVLGTIDRGKWTMIQLRCINPAWARELARPVDDASQALYDDTDLQILRMFAGNSPKFVDKGDPTAGARLQFTKQIIQQNPNYLRALDDGALLTFAGGPQQAQVLSQMVGPRQPNEIFSKLLIKWLTNLKFLGVTQPQNAQTGRIGVDANG